MSKDDKTNQYIAFGGTRFFVDVEMMSPQMTTLVESQDKIGRKKCVEGRISKHSTGYSHTALDLDQAILIKKLGLGKTVYLKTTTWCTLPVGSQEILAV